MLVILGLVVAVIVSLAMVIAALLTAPEAYEGERGLYIVRKTLPSTDSPRLDEEVGTIFLLKPGAYGARTRNLRRDRAAL
jgi:hypothetical protein